MDILTPYDEYPCHQVPQPFSHIPSTDLNWDEGYYFGVMNPDEQVMFCTGFRINPNTDMIGGYALINVGGVQRTFRFSRCWRREFNTRIGPFRMEVIEPLKTIRLALDDNESDIAFDFLWKGTSPAFLEEHHTATNRGRHTTDQRRYSQPGVAEGWLAWPDQRWDVGQPGWVAVRDHSWGLYVERPPIAPDPKWLPPAMRRARTAFCASGRYLRPATGRDSTISMRMPKAHSRNSTMCSARPSLESCSRAGARRNWSSPRAATRWSSSGCRIRANLQNC